MWLPMPPTPSALLVSEPTTKCPFTQGEAITVNWSQDGRIESNIGTGSRTNRGSANERLLGKFNDVNHIHCTTECGRHGESPEVLAEGGSKFSLADARSREESPQVLAEGGSKISLADARSREESPQVLAEGGSKFSLADARSREESPQVLAEGGSKFSLADARSREESPQVLAEGGSKFSLADARSREESPQVLAEGGSREDNNGVWPNNLVQKITEVVSSAVTCPTESKFEFKLTERAALHNWIQLLHHGCNLEKALSAEGTSPLQYGSEFRSVDVLEKIFGKHPNWSRMKSLLLHGSNPSLDDLPVKSRQADVKEALEYGNHKSAKDNPLLLKSLVENDVKYGYALAIPLQKLSKIPEALVAPMGIQRQNTIDERGDIIDKDRLTHDQSFEFGSGTSFNSRVHKDTLLPCMFGNAIKRLINWAVAARRKYPTSRILCQKIDYKSAYRRLHLNASKAIQSCTQLPNEGLALVPLRMTFGGSPNPNEWGVISESTCDLANALLLDETWNPAELESPNQHLVPPRQAPRNDVPIAEAKELIIDVHVDPRGIVDVYIDDKIGLSVEIPGTDNISRLERASMLAIHTLARPKHPNEPIPREEMEALKKLLAEAGAEETKIILGWYFDFRRLLISLPENKFIAWNNSIKSILDQGTASAKELERLIGRLVHLGQVLPQVYHFLSRLRNLQLMATKRRSVKVDNDCIEDLQLMQYFLEKVRGGISLNLLAFRRPSHIYRSDSCPHGLGGYSCTGFAWRFYLPEELLFRASNNLLEHIASIITVWIDILAKRIEPGDCCLSMVDSTTSEGWAYKTNFKEDGDDIIEAVVRRDISRMFARLLMDNSIKNYSQWFPGDDNNVSDALSHAGVFRNSSIAQRNQLLADLNAAEVARQAAVTGKTHDDQARAFRRWNEWTTQVGLDCDPFLDSFSRHERIRLLCAFAMALRQGRFSGSAYETLAEKTIRNTLSYVASTFRDNDRPNPSKDDDGDLGRLLSRQFRAFRNEDPNPKQQKALPICVLREMANNMSTETRKAIVQLGIGAFFFACRSCEYLSVPQAEKRRTDILRLRNIRFFLDGSELSQNDPDLHSADLVSITFEWQKNDNKEETVNQFATEDPLLCPVRQWSAIVKRIRNYPGADDETKVSAIWRFGRLEHITSKEMINALEDAVAAIGHDKLGIKPGEIGTHSIRSGAAMAMFLGECPVYVIMMIGRWSSDAFLRYIRRQVEQFSHNVSARMLRFQFHRHVPEFSSTSSRLDPRMRNHRDNAETRRNIGGSLARQARLPAFSLYN